jgi:ribonuclease T2
MRALAALLLLAAPAAAQAQAYQCTVPGRIEPVPPPRPDGPVRRTPIGRYTLAVSWSPEYCRGDTTTMQCSGANGRFGFVLHGLWPESRSGPPPQWCALTPRPSPQVLRANLCMTPVPWLLEHEWAKHGSCMSRTPERYFNTAAILWRSLSWPDADALSRSEGLTVGALRDAFVARNPGWRREMVGVSLSRSGWLRELRLCYNRDFRPSPCPRGNFGPPDSAALSIWRGL